MKKLFLFAVVVSLCLYLPLNKVVAQQVKEQHQQLKSDIQEAKSEQKDLRDQIHAAMQAGDYEKARQLKEQLRAARQENRQEIQQDLQAHPRAGDRLEDIRDRREDFRDRREDVRDRREDIRDRKENIHDRGQQQGVRDHGAGVGRGAGQGGAHRSEAARPSGGGGARDGSRRR